MSLIFPSFDSDNSLNYSSSSRWCQFYQDVLFALGLDAMEEIHYIEQFFIKLHNIYAFVCQVIFFIICQSAFNSLDTTNVKHDKDVLVALTTVLFYSVFGYFATRIQDICQRNRARTSTTLTPSLRSYLTWVCKIFLEWAKALVVVLCLREQGINYEPKLTYNIITFIYYLCSEKIFLQMIPTLVETMNIDRLENLEHLYVPLCMNILTIIAGITVVALCLFKNYSHIVLLSLYFIVYLRIKDAYYNYWELLITERATYSSFKVANPKDIEDWNDICAVCLNNMSRARITPCNHLFHPYCLKQCLRNSYLCPLCKQDFMEVRSRSIK